jgi:hypothetical protein
VGKYLDILKQSDVECRECDKSDESDKSLLFGRFGRLSRNSSRFCQTALDAMECRRPDYVEHDRWKHAVQDGKLFLAQWGKQADALGWTARDLFALHRIPEKPAPNYRRLSRYDETGLIWLLQGRPVVALTDATAAIENPTGAVTIYRRFNKPALGPVGDSLDDF